MGTFAGHTDGITYIDTKDDSRHIITNSKDQSIKLWDLRKFASKRSIEQTRKAVRNQNWDYRWARFPGMYKYIIYTRAKPATPVFSRLRRPNHRSVEKGRE